MARGGTTPASRRGEADSEARTRRHGPDLQRDRRRPRRLLRQPGRPVRPPGDRGLPRRPVAGRRLLGVPRHAAADARTRSCRTSRRASSSSSPRSSSRSRSSSTRSSGPTRRSARSTSGTWPRRRSSPRSRRSRAARPARAGSTTNGSSARPAGPASTGSARTAAAWSGSTGRCARGAARTSSAATCRPPPSAAAGRDHPAPRTLDDTGRIPKTGRGRAHDPQLARRKPTGFRSRCRRRTSCPRADAVGSPDRVAPRSLMTDDPDEVVPVASSPDPDPQDLPVPAGAPPPAPPNRPGASTFTIEGRAAPGLFVVGWLAIAAGARRSSIGGGVRWLGRCSPASSAPGCSSLGPDRRRRQPGDRAPGPRCGVRRAVAVPRVRDRRSPSRSSSAFVVGFVLLAMLGVDARRCRLRSAESSRPVRPLVFIGLDPPARRRHGRPVVGGDGIRRLDRRGRSTTSPSGRRCARCR